MDIVGKYGTAKIYAKTVDETSVEQIKTLLNQSMFDGLTVRVMPDCHSGKGCVIGFTSTIGDKIIPNLVGVDIGCTVSAYKIWSGKIDLDKLDKVIRERIPCGKNVREKPLRDLYDVSEVCDELGFGYSQYEYYCRSLGTLGGGNHFISVEKDEKTGDNWLIIHTGSRKFGKDICEYYQKLAIRKWSSYQKDRLKDIPPVERQKWILVEKEKKPSNELCYLIGDDRENYLRNMNVAQRFARTNHREIFNQIFEAMDYLEGDCIYTSHNYIDLEDRIIRKGAVCAKKNQRFLVPLNMKDGTLICIGKGNKEWNCSAPHGAGRLMSRKQAFEELSFGEYQRQMQGVYSTCIRPETLDESPMAYKPFDEIIECIKPTAKVVSHLKPIYNFKATE